MSDKSANKPKIVAAECRHAVFIPPVGDDPTDYHLVKEILHVERDGKVVTEPHLRVFKDFKRKFWVAKEGFRRYEQKKEWEKIENLKEYQCTQSQLLMRASKALGNFKPPRTLRQLAQSPYLYGADITSTSVIKQEVYRSRFPNTFTPSSVAATDTETSMQTGRIIMQTISYKERVYTAVVRSFLHSVGGDDAFKKKLIQEALVKYLGQDYEVLDKEGKPAKDKAGNQIYANVLKDRGIVWEVDIVEDDGAVVWNVLQKAHEWKPDILTFWNMSFDIKKMNESLDFHRINIANAWSDPIVPNQYKFFNYVEGQPKKVTASGKITPIPPQARWHKASCPASFAILDAMCCYKQVRTGKQEERSYGLDFILDKHLKRGKLKFAAADGLAKSDWHIFMQKNYPIEYIIYNVFDCVGLEMLDEKTKDLSVSVPSGAAMSDYDRFNSQPRRVCDKLHYFVLERGMVMGTTSDQMTTEMDAKTVSLRDWIVMLPAHLVADNGLKIILEYPSLTSNIRLHIGDLDVSASYPNGEVVFNISKQTTKKELISIDGVSESTRRMQGINLSGGPTNAVEVTTGFFGTPQMVTWLKAYRQRDNLAAVAAELRTVVDDAAGAAEAMRNLKQEEEEDA